jgi:hypothetical protein
MAEGTGEENGAPVLVRLILTRRGTRLSLARLKRHRGEPFLLRHGYDLVRQP